MTPKLISYAEYMKDKKCITQYCGNKPRHIKGRVSPGKFCHKCLSRKRKKNNFFMYHFDIMRQNAKRRKKDFNLSF